MKFLSFAIASLAAASGASAINLPSFEQFAIDSGLALAGLNGIALVNSAFHYKGGCNPLNVKVRREWRTLTKSQRRQYIAAVKCVLNKPSILPNGWAPGSKSLFDDFTWVHMNQTLFIHNTGNFLIWHRYFIQLFEDELQKCGYNGGLPYWEWGYDVKNPRDSPVFDGSDTSLGGDGEYIPNKPNVEITPIGSPGPIILKPGTGGGCVKTGPFAGMITHLGPSTEADPNQDNPRCLKRDLNPDCAQRFTSFRNTTELILNSPNIEIFRTHLEGDPRYTPYSLGVHGGGHFTIAGDPGADAFISPGDPAFYLHHSQVDRVYWIWQMLDFQNRQTVFGTQAIMDLWPAPNTTVEDVIDIRPVASKTYKIKELMNTVGGPLCYIYI